MPDPLDQGVILHLRAYRETSLLVDLLAQRHGRLRLLARGARRTRRGLGQSLGLFERIHFAVGGRGELRLLTQWEALAQGPMLKGQALLCGFYLAELLMRLIPLEDAAPVLFESVVQTLQGLRAGEETERLLRGFERILLEELGYGLNFAEDAEGQPIDPALHYEYRPAVGLCLSPEGSLGIPGTALRAIDTGCFVHDSDRRHAKRLMRGLIDAQLGGRPLKSRELFRSTHGGSST